MQFEQEPDIDWSTKSSWELEKQISPVRFSLSKIKENVLLNHIDNAINETQLVRSSIPHKLNIPYGPVEEDVFDIYGVDLPSTSPIIFWVHGGGWMSGSKDSSAFFLRNAYSLGFRSIVVGYQLCPETTIPQMCVAVSKSLEKAMEVFPQGQFILFGHSAGAHLIASILCGEQNSQKTYERISGLVLFSGLYDIRTVQNMFINEILKLTSEDSINYSPILNTHKILTNWKLSLKILIAAGKYDPPEFQRQGKILSQRIKRQSKLNCEYWESKEDDHFTIIENLVNPNSTVWKTLEKFLITNITENKEKSKL